MQYHNITKDDMLNGDGLRVVLWVAGCGHACPGCHNPITWDAEGGLLFDQAAKNELFTELGKDYISGITFSGGDPLFPGNRLTLLGGEPFEPENQRVLAGLLRQVKEKYPQKDIWCYTGYQWETLLEKRDPDQMAFLKQIDVLIDGRFVQAQADPQLHWRGSANQRVIDVPRTLAANSIVLHDDK